ncbi:MAG: PAS domain S-box protein [Cyclobacteriaceae bacterium]|nr:PAS domain S-box protein [Cyclobacteriaceae bacterium SS2]
MPYRFNTEELPALEAYNAFMEKHHVSLNNKLRSELIDDPTFGPLIQVQSQDEQKAQQAHSRKLEHEAITENKWKAHSDHLLKQGITYARLGLKFSDWFRVIKHYRDTSLPFILEEFKDNPAEMARVLEGMNKMVDLGLSVIAEAYIIEKNALIKEEQREKEEAQKELQKSESRFQALFENSPDHIFMVNKEGIIEFINHVAPELKREEVVGANLLDFQSDESRSKVEKALKYTFDTGKPTIYETKAVLHGVSRYYASSVAPVFSGSDVVSVAVISRDHTERVLAEQEVRKLNLELEERVKERTANLVAINEELESFTYTVSHDLRAPIRAIDGFTKILVKKLDGRIDEKESHYLDCVLEGSKKMGNLIDDLLSFSRMGRIEKRVGQFSMHLLFQQVFTDLTTHQDLSRIDFSMEPLPEIRGDREMFRLAINNLIGNALKYSSTREKSIIRVKCEEDGQRFVFSVSDNGVGFEMEYQNKIFEIFQRLHDEDEFEGSGVGLAIVKKIINRHGGKLWVNSELDKGTTFYFSIPK